MYAIRSYYEFLEKWLGQALRDIFEDVCEYGMDWAVAVIALLIVLILIGAGRVGFLPSVRERGRRPFPPPPRLATPRAGICWPFVANASVAVQSPLDNARGIQITFQISRNSFQSGGGSGGGGGGGALSLHPGFSVHLVPADLHSRLRVSTSIESAFAQSLNDKRSLRLDIRKEIVADVAVSSPFSNGVCLDNDGGGADSVQHQQKGAQIVDIASAGLLCLLEKAVEQCACVPMLVVLWTLQGDLDSPFFAVVHLLLILCRPSATAACLPMPSNLPLSLTKSGLFTLCTVCWLLQSLPALFLYLEGADFVKRRSVPAEHLALPHLLFCNRFPFTQAGLASLGAQFNRDFVLAYLRQWLDPSVGFGLPADDDAAMPGGIAQLSADDRTTAEATIAQLLPNGRLKQRLEQLMPQCQDMVSSCVLRGHQLSGFDCCRMVQPWLATPRAGICWPFVANASAAVQSPLDNARGIQITFQISRNSFQSGSGGGGGGGALSLHPGFSVHLVPADLHSRLRVSTSIESAFAQSLNDKRSLRLDIRKEIVADVAVSSPFSNGVCLDSDGGGGADSVQHQQKGAQIVDIASAGLLCLLEKAVEQCACVPMLVVLWTLQGDLDSTFLRRFNASTICTVGEFDHCVHPFVEFAMAPAWDRYPTPSDAGPELKAAVDTCRKAFPRVCARAQFPARSQQRDLPPEYQNTQTSAAHPVSPPPRPLPRGGARQLPPLTIASSSSTSGGGNNGGGGTLGGSSIMEDGGREGPNNASSPPVDDEPPQRRRRGPKLALDELEG
uniref:Uncharacterized protein n=1 Tax=Globodera pallida TaxID=36090 RepID=A0A183BJK2_GLOPA